MAVLYVRATYAEEENLKSFFKSMFGWGETGVEVCVPGESVQSDSDLPIVDARSLGMHNPTSPQAGTLSITLCLPRTQKESLLLIDARMKSLSSKEPQASSIINNFDCASP